MGCIPDWKALLNGDRRAVGFLKYWTVSNLPLFLLAAPMLYLLLCSGIEAWSWSSSKGAYKSGIRNGRHLSQQAGASTSRSLSLVTVLTEAKLAACLGIPQVILAILALSTYHVQIINRLSSGYPVWYWWLASIMVNDRAVISESKKQRSTSAAVRGIIMYAIIQAALFAAFLPPA